MFHIFFFSLSSLSYICIWLFSLLPLVDVVYHIWLGRGGVSEHIEDSFAFLSHIWFSFFSFTYTSTHGIFLFSFIYDHMGFSPFLSHICSYGIFLFPIYIWSYGIFPFVLVLFFWNVLFPGGKKSDIISSFFSNYILLRRWELTTFSLYKYSRFLLE